MNKSIRKTVLLTTIFCLCFGFSAFAAYNTEYQCENNLATIVSAVNQGQYTLLTDEYDEQGLVHTNQWNEYQLMLSQGSPKVVCVWTNGSSSGYYGIIAYQLEGQQKVTLPENAVIKVTDKYNLDHLSILKYVGNQLGSSQLFNVNATLEKEKQEIKKSQEKAAAERAKQQAEAKADQQQIDLNNQINAELNTKSENKAGQKTSLPYSSDYITKYVLSQEEISHNKVWASFDNERNYIQQWLTAHGFNSMQELKNYAYKTGVTHYGLQEQVAIQYCQYVEEGKCSSIGDYIRLKFKEGQMKEWNQLAKWTNYCDFTVINAANTTGNKLILYVDEYNINKEVYKMLEANLSVIASYTSLTKEQKTAMVEQFKNGKNYWSDGISNADLGRKYVNGYESAGELGQRLLNKWNTEYLPNIKE